MQTYTVLYQHCYYFFFCSMLWKVGTQKRGKLLQLFCLKIFFTACFSSNSLLLGTQNTKGNFSWINFCICLMFAWNGSKLLTNIYLRDQCDLFTLFHRLRGVLDSLLSLLLFFFFGNSFVYHALTNVDRICRLTYQINEHVHA